MPGRRADGERGAHQLAFGVRAPVVRGRVDELRRVLAAMAGGDGAPGGARMPFETLSGVHFGRLLLLEDVDDLQGEPIPASLLLMTEVDSPLARHLDELASLGGRALDAAFGLCEGYPAAPDAAARVRFLREHRLEPQARYVNTVGRTLEQILREEELRRAIERFLDAHRGELPADPAGARAAIQDFVAGEPALAWARRRAPRPRLAWRARELAHAVGCALALLLATPLLLVVVPIWALVLRYHEARDPAPHVHPDPEHLRALAALEDFGAQNQFSAIGFVKPGWFRAATIAAVLWLIDYAARHVFNRADLAGVKTIHFARWTMLDGRRRAIFTSNYDGSVESYMDDFIDKVAFGLNASFSHGVGYPRTRFLLFDGAKREDEFKDYLRAHQVPTQVWYSAYDQLTARNVENNALIRSGLFGPMADADAAAWLRRL
jgi:hypothetical protein